MLQTRAFGLLVCAGRPWPIASIVGNLPLFSEVDDGLCRAGPPPFRSSLACGSEVEDSSVARRRARSADRLLGEVALLGRANRPKEDGFPGFPGVSAAPRLAAGVKGDRQD